MCFPQRCLDSTPCLACDRPKFFLYTNTHQECGLEFFFSTHAYEKQNKVEKNFFLTKFLQRYRCLSAGPGPEALIMSRFMELREFGDAATFLRKTNLEQLAAQSHAFDGTVRRPVCILCFLLMHKPIRNIKIINFKSCPILTELHIKMSMYCACENGLLVT